jgi:hypothetical protein
MTVTHACQNAPTLNNEKSIPNRTPYRLLLRSAYCINRCFLSCIFDNGVIFAVGFKVANVDLMASASSVLPLAT